MLLRGGTSLQSTAVFGIKQDLVFRGGLDIRSIEHKTIH